MALTLAEAKVGYTDKIDQQVIDEFRRDSVLLDKLTFDDTISPTGGSNLVYGYQRLETPSTAGIRQINQEYTPNEAKRTKQTASPVILGGSFEIDRVIAQTSGAINELDFQIKQKTLAGANYFHNLVINGTSAATGTGYIVNTFDGLKKILAGKSTEVSTNVDVSTTSALDSNYNALLDELDAFIALLAAKPDILMMNTKMLTKIRAAARRAGYYDRTKNDFGNYVETYNGIALLDAGQYYDGAKTVDVVDTTTPTESAYGTTSIYAAKLGLDAFHGISVDGSKMLNCEASLVDVTNPTVSFKTTSGVIKAYGYAYETTKSQWGGSTNTTIYAFNGTNYYKPAYYGSPTATNITLGVSGGKLTGLPSGLSGGTLLVVRGI